MRISESKNKQKPGAENCSAPGFFRRMAAVIYDALLLFAVLFFATVIALPFNSGQAFSSGQYYFSWYLFGVSYFFYTWFWTHGGQTLGLRAWKMMLVNTEGTGVNWRQATLRYFAALLSWACFGFGFFWSLFDKNRLCWHDRLSKTYLCRSAAEKNGRPK
ncbi:RDD family protein [Methylomonas sp. MgM2]